MYLLYVWDFVIHFYLTYLCTLYRPVSINVERDVDMSITGQRHAFYFTYSAGCSKDGMLKYFDAHLYKYEIYCHVLLLLSSLVCNSVVLTFI